MDMQGTRHLDATQQQAWDALNDPQVLQRCIPGCDRFEAAGQNEYLVGMAVKVGPVSARFAGRVQLADSDPPRSYRLSFEGQGGVAGFCRGQSLVTLGPPGAGSDGGGDGGGCDLAYSVQAQVGGKLAQVGQRLVDGAAQSMAQAFFERFGQEMQALHAPPVPSSAVPPPADAQAAAAPARQPWWVRLLAFFGWGR